MRGEKKVHHRGTEATESGLILILIMVFGAQVRAQPALYACANVTSQYVVGSKLALSGVFRRGGDGSWQHSGYNHPFIFALDSDGASLFLAAGNGLIRVSKKAEQWTTLTGSDVTELRDLSIDRRAPGTIYFAHTRGVRITQDGGKTWRELGTGLHRKFTQAVRVDPEHPGAIVAGGEEGIFRSENEGKTWRLAGAAGFQILRIEVSPVDHCFWMAATQRGGAFASHDCGQTFENIGSVGVGSNLYDIAFDPTTAGRVAVAGWGVGVLVSSDAGKTWQARNAGLPGTNVTSIAFDPVNKGRLYAAVYESAVYVSQEAGLAWSSAGLEGSHVNQLRFVMEGAGQ